MKRGVQKMCDAGMKKWLLAAGALLTVNGFAVTVSALPLALTPSTSIDVSSGAGSASGAVSNSHQIFNFLGNAGDMVSLSVNVVQFGPGTVFNNDDTRLFLFNELGKYETRADSLGSNPPPALDFTLPTDGTYYAAITTGFNRPLFGADGSTITGWADTGMGNVSFELNVEIAAPPTTNPVPEPATMLLFGTGLVGAAGYRRRKKG